MLSGQDRVEMYYVKSVCDKFITEPLEDEIAADTPFCVSEKLFKEDVETLIGLNPGEDAKKILNNKRVQFWKKEFIQDIKDRNTDGIIKP